MTYGSLSNFNDPCFCTSLKARSVRPLLDGQGRDIHLEDGEVAKSENCGLKSKDLGSSYFRRIVGCRRSSSRLGSEDRRRRKKNVLQIDLTNEKWFGPRVVLAA